MPLPNTRHLVVAASIAAFLMLCTVGGCQAGGSGGGAMQAPTAPIEFRSMFVTTAYNMDWPSQPGLHRRVQKDEIEATVSRAKELNCNVIILQVRAFGDRIGRKTSLAGKYHAEPWAMALNHSLDPDTGPVGGYDPLEEWIYACREAGIELHAWINPFRVNTLVTIKDENGKDVYLPVLKWNKQLWLNPYSKAVQDYVLEVVCDLLKNYGPPGPVNCPHDVIRRPRAAAPVMDLMIMAADDDGGFDGIIYDHYNPPPPPPGGPSTSPSTPLSGGGAAVTKSGNLPGLKLLQQVSEAERRVDWLITKYKLPTTPKVQNDQPATLEDFIIASANLIKPKAKFGYSPEAKDNVAKGWFSDGHFNYVVPELYFKRGGGNPNVFKTKLIEWIDANTSNQSPKPLVVAGLFTKRVQVPEDDEEEGWPDEEIVDQMQDVRDAVGAGEKKASGETHFAASALRLPDQAGPRPKDPPGPPPPGAKPPKKNLAQKLKEKHYKAKALVPKMRATVGVPLGKPTVAFKPKAGGARDVEWAPAAPNQKPHTWAVWVSTNNTWGDMQVFPRKVMKLEDIDPAVDKVRVMAIDRDGTQSLAGETP